MVGKGSWAGVLVVLDNLSRVNKDGPYCRIQLGLEDLRVQPSQVIGETAEAQQKEVFVQVYMVN